MTNETTSDPAAAAEVFYDGACPLCRREIALWRRALPAGAVAWTDISTAHPPPDLDRRAALARFHVRVADGRLVSGARAFLALWRNSLWLRPAAILLDRWPFAQIAEGGYRVFLRVRRLWR